MSVHGRVNGDEKLAAELAGGATVAEASASAGVSDRTAFRRLTDPTFKARVVELRAQMVAEAAGRLSRNMTAAADVLAKLLKSEDEHVQHKAAVKLIELGLKVTELAELENRVRELEQAASTRKKIR